MAQKAPGFNIRGLFLLYSLYLMFTPLLEQQDYHKDGNTDNIGQKARLNHQQAANDQQNAFRRPAIICQITNERRRQCHHADKRRYR